MTELIHSLDPSRETSSRTEIGKFGGMTEMIELIESLYPFDLYSCFNHRNGRG